jgi:coenzyme F420-reducing hydrogenase alpha subunit
MHDTLEPPGAALDAALAGPLDADFDVGMVTRVEGEGSLHLRVRGGLVEEAHLAIFEAPRYFEELVVGRTPNDVIDIVARICGICPIAYQMSAVHAFEDLFGVAIAPETRRLRRLLYCGEWIESHALHVYLLHAPDFLGYPSAVHLARDNRAVVEQGLALKRTGNSIVKLLGGRPIHPVSVRVGGFSRAPRRAEVAALRPALEQAVEQAEATVRLVAGLTAPSFEREPRLVALRHPAEYPFNDGRIVSSDGLDLPIGGWDAAFDEQHVAWSNALQARMNGGGRYLLGPSARVTLDAAQLHPRAAALLAEIGLADEIRRNPYWSIAARAIELVHATAEALEIADTYVPPDRPREPWVARPGSAAWSSEAPRGLLFHRYEVDDRGLVSAARIVPPTSQNQVAIEADLAEFAPSVLRLPHEEATLRLEQLIRSYDPCISCATHFLDLRVDHVT